MAHKHKINNSVSCSPCTGCDWAKDMNRHMRAAAQSSVYRCRVCVSVTCVFLNVMHPLRSKTTRVNRRVKRSCDITVNGMTVTITEIETISTNSDDFYKI